MLLQPELMEKTGTLLPEFRAGESAGSAGWTRRWKSGPGQLRLGRRAEGLG